jgi:hypothetical protein
MRKEAAVVLGTVGLVLIIMAGLTALAAGPTP